MARDSGFGHGESLSANAVHAFGLIVAGMPVPDEDADSVAELVAWGCVTTDPDDENRLVALNPKVAARRRLMLDAEEALLRLERLRCLPDVADELYGQYQRVQLRAGGGAEYIADPAVVNARLDDVVGSAEREILAAQPAGPRSQGQLARSLERDSAALGRGVEKRTIYRATVRDNPVTAEYARTMSNRASGRSAEFATLAEPFERIIIVDRQTAFISNHLVAGAPEHAAWQVTDQAVIAYMVEEYLEKWRRADPWRGEVRGRSLAADIGLGVDGVRTTPRQREVMRDMVAGNDQRATATRLGVSERTVSAEINALKDLFDAESREQLAFKWAFSPDRLVGVTAVEVGQDAVDTAA
ncbi:LuxR C-terminal-related transcriptional regulator [Streptomyces chartreusis]|uniref:LuxR C-terminal-related transcriptional regulator n=1 Tax=Streptomyces chartreusis TaxID=1969 RepID=UPI003720F799